MNEKKDQAYRSRIYQDEIEGLVIEISPPYPFLDSVLILPFFLILAIINLVPIFPLFTGQHGPNTDLIAGGFVIFLLCTIGGALCVIVFTLSLFTIEEIRITSDEMIFRRHLGPFSAARAYSIAQIRNLRYAPLAPSVADIWIWNRAVARSPYPNTSGVGAVVAFDTLGKTLHFGHQLPEVEARRLIATIKQHIKIPDDPYDKPLPIEE